MANIKCKLRMQIITKLISNLMCDHTFATESSRRCCVLCRMMMNRLWKYDVTSYKYECYEMWWGNRVVAELEPEIFNSTWPETALGRVRHTKRVFPASISSLIHLCSSCPNCVSRMCGVRAWVAWLVRFAQQQGHQVGHSRGSWLTYLEIPKQIMCKGNFYILGSPLIMRYACKTRDPPCWRQNNLSCQHRAARVSPHMFRHSSLHRIVWLLT